MNDFSDLTDMGKIIMETINEMFLESQNSEINACLVSDLLNELVEKHKETYKRMWQGALLSLNKKGYIQSQDLFVLNNKGGASQNHLIVEERGFDYINYLREKVK